MNAVIEHIKKTCPHYSNKSRQALRNNRFDLYNWPEQPEFIAISELMKSNCKPCSKRDVARYQKLIRKGSNPPAVVVTSKGSILDGAHRLQALINEGHTHTWAFVGQEKDL